jgi:hypothetical protein
LISAIPRSKSGLLVALYGISTVFIAGFAIGAHEFASGGTVVDLSAMVLTHVKSSFPWLLPLMHPAAHVAEVGFHAGWAVTDWGGVSTAKWAGNGMIGTLLAGALWVTFRRIQRWSA